jgi:hypothetical protein
MPRMVSQIPHRPHHEAKAHENHNGQPQHRQQPTQQREDEDKPHLEAVTANALPTILIQPQAKANHSGHYDPETRFMNVGSSTRSSSLHRRTISSSLLISFISLPLRRSA